MGVGVLVPRAECRAGKPRAGVQSPLTDMGSGHRRAQELCEQGGGPGLSFPNPILPPSLINHTVYVDVKHHQKTEDGVRKANGGLWSKASWALHPPPLFAQL